jgi:hypothetical protein
MKDQADLSAARKVKEWNARGTAVHAALTDTVKSKTASIQAFLASRSANFRQYWIVNALRVRADAATIEELKKRPDVASVTEERTYAVPRPQRAERLQLVDGVEWGIANIRANSTWDEFGSLGEDIVIANIDTGVQFDHPALARQYRGNSGDSVDHNYNWFDPSNVCGSPSLAPCDNAGHGTHTMGTMVGEDEAGENRIGVAPRAKWIAAKGCEDFGCSEQALLASAQWILAPTDLNGENPRPDLRPNIVNNSWGGGGGDTFYQAAVQAWVAAGIFPVFSSGNSGPSCGSTGSPGDYPESYAAAAYDINNEIAIFSSRGPGMLATAKPNIAAPGVAVRSSVPGDGYDSYDGTSMAAPHIAGSIALLWSAAPTLVGDIEGTRALLDTTAVNTGDPGECGGDEENNYTFGQGRLDTYASVDAAPRGPAGKLVGVVKGEDDKGITTAKVYARTADAPERSVGTDREGAYSIKLAVGTYDVEVRAFGFLPATASGVAITENVETRKDFTLEEAPSFDVTGTIKDDKGVGIRGVTVTLLGTPIRPVKTDLYGRYALGKVPVGEYQVKFDAGGCYEVKTEALEVSAATTLDVTLPKRFDVYGYSCGTVPQTYVEAATPLITSGDDLSVPFKLPFPFIYYGKAYETVNVNSNGVLHFDSSFVDFINSPIPSTSPPNAAIYALWTDLYIDEESSVYTDVVGSEPNRQVVVEWRNVPLLTDPSQRFSFEVVLGEQGDITLQYAAKEEKELIGGVGTIGIEDGTGADGLQFSYNRPSLETGTSVSFTLPPSGLVKGTVTDSNDGEPIANALVTAKRNDKVIRQATTDSKGNYLLQLTAQAYKIGVAPERYSSAEEKLTIVANTITELSFALDTGAPEVKPSLLELVVAKGDKRTRELTLTNRGKLPLQWSLSESGGALQSLVNKPAAAGSGIQIAGTAANSGNSRAHMGRLPSVTGWQPQAVGDVLFSFNPQGLLGTWGVGFDGNLWLSDYQNLTNVEFNLDGTPAGRSWPAPWAGFFPGDMAFDTRHNLMCQVAVGGDNGIHCWNRDTGAVESRITGAFAWTAIPQRGLAYDPNDDTFYIGGWEEGIIYHVRGTTHATPGEVLGQCSPADPNISGLALNTSMGVLWEATNSETDAMYELNPADCTVLSTVDHPEPFYNGAGLELDAIGNLYLVSQASNTVYLVESGVPSFSDVPWLTAEPGEGTLAPGASVTLTVDVDTAGLEPGVYLAGLHIVSDAGRTPNMRIPVSLVVSEYQRAIDVGTSRTYIDSLEDPWGPDQKYAGDWGYVNDSLTWTTSHSIAGTQDPTLYRSLRVDPFGYRFDDVPNGVYQVELRFAQLLDLDPGQRQFDVIVEDTLVLPAYDPAYRSGAYHADDHTFFVPVTDGQLDVRFATRVGLPIINALRVTHRPDR